MGAPLWLFQCGATVLVEAQLATLVSSYWLLHKQSGDHKEEQPIDSVSTFPFAVEILRKTGKAHWKTKQDSVRGWYGAIKAQSVSGNRCAPSEIPTTCSKCHHWYPENTAEHTDGEKQCL